MVLECDSSNSTWDEHAEHSIIHQTLLGAMQEPDLLDSANSIISPTELKQVKVRSYRLSQVRCRSVFEYHPNILV